MKACPVNIDYVVSINFKNSIINYYLFDLWDIPFNAANITSNSVMSATSSFILLYTVYTPQNSYSIAT